jgi:hypothetical protein
MDIVQLGMPGISSSHSASEFFFNIVPDRRLEIPVFDADFGKTLGEDRGLSGRGELLVDDDKALGLENAISAFKVPFLIADCNAAVRGKGFKFLENLFLGHTC